MFSGKKSNKKKSLKGFSDAAAGGSINGVDSFFYFCTPQVYSISCSSS